MSCDQVAMWGGADPVQISAPFSGSHWQAGTVRVDGIALRFHRTGGDLPTIVLAHGITDRGLCWARLSRPLEDDYDMVMYDTHGQGQSDAEHVAGLSG